jgi:hypothetical protein
VSATAIGIVAVVALHGGANATLAFAQIIGILLTAACSFLSGIRFWNVASPLRSKAAHFSRDLIFVWPHFLFGSLYYVFLFADRLLAWTRPDLAAASTVVFRGAYETALDIALISFVLQVGWVRYAIVGLFRSLTIAEKDCRVHEPERLCYIMRQRYIATSLKLMPLAAVVSIVVYLAAQSLRVGGRDVEFTLRWSLAAMPFLVIGLWNSNLQFRLGCLRSPLIALGMGLIVDIVCGYLFSRLGSYKYAICGFTIGAITFAVLGSAASLKVLQSVDYFYFASAL